MTNNNGEEMSYLDYMKNHNDEYVERYTNNNEKPPHCDELAKIYEEYIKDKYEKIFYVNGYLDNASLIVGIQLCIACYVKSADNKLDTETEEQYTLKQNHVSELIKEMTDCYVD